MGATRRRITNKQADKMRKIQRVHITIELLQGPLFGEARVSRLDATFRCGKGLRPARSRLRTKSRRLVALPYRVLPEASCAYVLPLLARLVAATLEVIVKANILASWILGNTALIQQLAGHTLKWLLAVLALALAFLF